MNNRVGILFTILLCMVGTKAFAHDIAVVNADGMTIYYNYINDGRELEVTYIDNYFGIYSGDVVIPEEVTFMNRTRKVTSIGEGAFIYCKALTSVTIPNSVNKIGGNAFADCDNLTSVHISNLEAWCNISFRNESSNPLSWANSFFLNGEKITDLMIPNNVTSIGDYVFFGWSGLNSVTIPNNVTSIGKAAFAYCINLTFVAISNSVTFIGNKAFYSCRNLTSFTIPNNVTYIGLFAFGCCSGLTSITIPNSVTGIGNYAFSGCDWDLSTVISLIETPFDLAKGVFSKNTFNNATLYVPIGTIDKYKSTEGWKDFLYIEEGSGGNTTTEPTKCEKPTISYKNGLLTFNCATEGAECQSTIIDTDIKSYSGNEVQLGVTYEISVYATKVGYENSETATATLCWIDVEPKTDGIENGVAHVKANAILIQTDNGQINITGTNDGTKIYVYGIDGQQIGSSMSYDGQASINTNLQSGSVAIIKIGDRSVKVAIK